MIITQPNNINKQTREFKLMCIVMNRTTTTTEKKN